MRAVVLRDGGLVVRETADPVPGPGQLLLRPLSAAICASDVHYMDHPNSAPRFVWDSGRDTIMGHEFIGEVVGHGPACSDGFPIGSRVTSLPLLIRDGAEPYVIGLDEVPDAIDAARKSQGPPRVVVHPTAAI
jgi:threonine dehydrogenase-like Zn-dependent dehydrogenase